MHAARWRECTVTQASEDRQAGHRRHPGPTCTSCWQAHLPPHDRASQAHWAGLEGEGRPRGMKTLFGETELFSILITVMVSQYIRTSKFFTLYNLNTIVYSK